jgi:hypothetical protein
LRGSRRSWSGWESDPGPNEREEIQALLAQFETALNLLDPRDAAGPSDE